MHKMAVLIAPYRDRTDEDVADLGEAKLQLLLMGWLPIFLPDTLGSVLDDHDDEQRTVAINASAYFCSVLALHSEAEAIVVGRVMTEGMTSDVRSWLDAGGPAPINIADLARLEEEDTDGSGD